MTDPEWIKRDFAQTLDCPDEQIDLTKATLKLARLEYPELDVIHYLNTVNQFIAQTQARLPQTRYPLKIIQQINEVFFQELGFRGNQENYYDPQNSFLNDVIDRRLGIPISLSVVYLAIAKGINFPMVGIGMPGHFLIRPEFEDVGIFVDVFNQGEVLFEQDCQAKLQELYQQPIALKPHFLTPVSNRQILVRMLTNLKFIYLNRQHYAKMLQAINFILLLLPNHPLELRDRGLLYYQLENWQQASDDLRLYLALLPEAEDARIIQEILQKIS